MSGKTKRTALLAVIAVLLTAGSALWLLAAPEPDAVLPDGSRYYGELHNMRPHGQGRLEWMNGAVYEGGFQRGVMAGEGRHDNGRGRVYEGEYRDGLYHGRGRLTTSSGMRYEGEFEHGEPAHGLWRDGRGGIYQGEFDDWRHHGQGRLETSTGEVREGEFSHGRFVRGTLTEADGTRHEGQFHEGLLHGDGSYIDTYGNTYSGRFVQGVLDGEGEYRSLEGETYRGQFEHGQYHGEGHLVYADGTIHEGNFWFGYRHGPGRETHPESGEIREGEWIWDEFESDHHAGYDAIAASVEQLLYSQPALLQASLDTLLDSDSDQINLYLLAIGGDGYQEVFRREVEYVSAQFAEQFGTEGRTVKLINSRTSHTHTPLATTTAIAAALEAIAQRMDTRRDILFIFITSHGSSQHELSLDQEGLDLPDLPAARLGELLADSGIRWKVAVISACYAGGFVAPLDDGRTLIMTAADDTSQSFGCSDEADFTYFGKAYFQQSLNGQRDFIRAFEQAVERVRERETEEGITRHSSPQILAPEPVVEHLHAWLRQFGSD